MFNRHPLLANLTLYSLLHFLVDCLCALFALGTLYHLSAQIHLLILYNLLAFGTQPLWGLANDVHHQPHRLTATGCLLVCLGAWSFYLHLPLTTIILIGLGNAAFHVGSGTICLALKPRCASAIGIYVAPGALGLFLGTYYAASPPLSPTLIFITLTLILVIISQRLPLPPKLASLFTTKNPSSPISPIYPILFFTTITIACRSFVGLALTLPWKTTLVFSFLAVFASASGKFFGGILADRFGWRKIGVGGLLIALPIFTLATTSLPLSLLGLLCFNFTMAPTMVHLSNLLPGHPGFAYGLSCLALVLGALPVLLGLGHVSTLIIGTLVFISSLTLWLALRPRPAIT